MAAYDGVTMFALAMLSAHSTDPHVFNAAIMDVTAPAAGTTVVNAFASGEAALNAGKRIQYQGATGPSCSIRITIRPASLTWSATPRPPSSRS